MSSLALMRRLLVLVVDIRPGERTRTFALTASLLSVLAAHTLVEPVAYSLFLRAWGPERLPYLYLASVLPAALVTSFYSRFSRSERMDRVIIGTLLFLGANLLALRWLLGANAPGGRIILYLWTSVFGLLVTSQFWLLANHLFDARAARRLFGFIGMGAILGGVLGGGLAARLAPRIGSENLLLVAVPFTLCAALLTGFIGRRERAVLVEQQREARKEAILGGNEGVWPAIRSSAHLRLLVLFGGATVLAATLVDFLFKSIAAHTYATEDGLTSFLGYFQAGLSVLSFFLQFVLMSAWAPLLRGLGLLGVLSILPTVLLAGAAALLILPQLATASLLKAADASLRYSIHRPTFELLFLPVPIEVKRRTKAAVDLFGDRLARAAAGVVLLALLAFDAAGPRTLAVGLALAALAVAVLIIRLADVYVSSLRATIAGRALDLDRHSVQVLDAASISVLRRALQEEPPRQVTYALEQLQAVAGPWLRPDLHPLLDRREPEVRLGALDLLATVGTWEDATRVAPLVGDGDDATAAAAVRFLCRRGGIDQLDRFLAGTDLRARAAAVACLSELGSEGLRRLDRPLLRALLDEPGEHRAFARRSVAQVLGATADARFADLLEELIRDPDPTTATHAIAAAGEMRDPILVPLLLARLRQPEVRESARRALAAYGEPLLPAIEHALADPRNPRALRTALPRVLAYMGTPGATQSLIAHLSDSDLEVRLAALKALGRLREDQPSLRVDQQTLGREIGDEARRHYQLLALLRHTDGPPAGPGRELLRRALREDLDQSLARIFRLLGLGYPPRDIFTIYRKVVNAPAEQRANALELLENLLAPDLKQMIFPIIDPPSIEAALDRGQRLFHLEPGGLVAGLRRLLESHDPWLRAVTYHLIGEERMEELADDCRRAADDPDPLVRAEARRALVALTRPPSPVTPSCSA